MLVLLGPDFDGSPEAYARLAQATGLVSYDLKARLKPGSWGVVKAFGDVGAARDLAGKLNAAGFSPVLVDRGVSSDPERRVVPVSGVRLEEAALVLLLRDREMPVPYQALCCIVEGEVQIGRIQSHTAAPSSSSFRAPTPGELAAFSPTTQAPAEAFLAADLHFATVLWIARIDVRHFDFGADHTGAVAQDLEILLQRIAERAGDIRVDRSVKISSVASFALQKAVPSGGSWPPLSSDRMKEDQRFDPYSRIVGEAERQYRLGTVGN